MVTQQDAYITKEENKSTKRARNESCATNHVAEQGDLRQHALLTKPMQPNIALVPPYIRTNRQSKSRAVPRLRKHQVLLYNNNNNNNNNDTNNNNQNFSIN